MKYRIKVPLSAYPVTPIQPTNTNLKPKLSGRVSREALPTQSTAFGLSPTPSRLPSRDSDVKIVNISDDEDSLYGSVDIIGLRHMHKHQSNQQP